MLIIRRLATALAFVLCAAPARVAAQDGAAAPDQPVLAAGDVLRVTVWQRADLSGDFVVAGNGSLAHPLYREGPAVAGVPLAAVDARVRTFLSTFLARPQFVLEPLLRVTVTGAVREPKLYTLPPETSVAQAIAYAGGVTERGKRDRVRLVRQGRVSDVDLTRPGSALARTPIRSGDEIVVEQSRAFFREVFAPAMAVLGAVAAIVNVAIDSGNN